MATYSFNDVNVTIAGAGGFVLLGAGAGAADEGIDIASVGTKNTMTIGADGTPMHALNAGSARTVTVNLLKTSPYNAILMAMYNLQSSSSSIWGNNIITVSILQNGEVIALSNVAFQKVPDLGYAKAPKNVTWVFDAGTSASTLGVF